ncbi:hypothetical protein HGRIS_011675 [Hohenbuehelia grisea]|uniref:Protein kinase domain-containing protein n=1 Tax=Hohenbuehelia grisea TaxID=104357 RepID=A0ABR3JW10_9AGAR
MSVPMSKPVSCPPTQRNNLLPTPPVMAAERPAKSCPPAISCSPPKAPPIKYAAPLGTRWAKEKAAAGGSGAFDLPTDPKRIGPWILGECVGKGASGRVKIAKHAVTGQLAAVKILPIAPLHSTRDAERDEKAQAKQEKQRLGIDREITMMKLMDHPNIMRIYDVYEGARELFLVLEYVSGGELFDFLVNRGRLPPIEALIYFRQIIYGLNYAHTFSIIHRDLKPENILIDTLDPPTIKIADWGMAAFAPPTLQLETSCGSPHYASPEIVNGEKYRGNATDIWSCGVILFALLTGRLPFDDKNVRSLLSKVKSGKYEIPAWIDPLAKDLLSRMLVVDVKQRITIPEILAHPWLHARPPPHSPIMTTLPPSAVLLLQCTPPLPPSPSELALPLLSPAHVDRELLASLQIIWGRHADTRGDCIVRDLCAPVGEGTLAKAFYFLLGKYRERVRKAQDEAPIDPSDKQGHAAKPRPRPASCVIGLGKECELAFGAGGELQLAPSQLAPEVPRPYVRRASTIGGPVPIHPPRYAHPTAQYTYTPRPQSSVGNSGAHAQLASTGTAPKNDGGAQLALPAMSRAPATVSGITRERPPSPAGPRPPTSSSHSRRDDTVPTSSPTKRPSGPRRGYTYSHPNQPQVDPPRSSVAFPCAVMNVDRPRASRVRPTSELPGRSVHEISTTADTPAVGSTPTTTPTLAPVVAPRTANEELQRVMDEISARVNEMASQPRPALRRTQTEYPVEPISSSAPAKSHMAAMMMVPLQVASQTQAQMSGRRPSSQKENQQTPYADEGWSYVQINMDGQEKKDEKSRKSGGKQGGRAQATKSGKPRPPALELASLNAANVGASELSSPIILTSPINISNTGTPLFADQIGRAHARANTTMHPPSHVYASQYGQREQAHQAKFKGVSSPVVGEFKGWFSNLFHWKGHATPVQAGITGSPIDYFGIHGGKGGGLTLSNGGSVLYAHADVAKTRVDVLRILSGLGAIVEVDSVEHAHAHARASPQPFAYGSANSGVTTLKCRVGDSQPGMKSMRFRVELSAVSPYLHSPHPQLHNSDERRTPPPLLSPESAMSPLLQSAPPSQSRPRSGSTPSDSSSSGSSEDAADSSYFDLTSVQCRTAIVLVQEKGSTTTFKTIWRVMRDEIGKVYGPPGILTPNLTQKCMASQQSGQWLVRPPLLSPLGSMEDSSKY